MVNLEWFRTFKAIYETGSLTAAANRLFISQPGVSVQLGSLEAYTGRKLFDRSTRKMVPTEHGKVLYNAITEGVTKLEEVEKRFSHQTKAERASLGIGMCFEYFQLVLEPYLSGLPFDLVSKFGHHTELLSDLDKGTLDFVVTSQEEDIANIRYTPFAEERILLIAGAGHDLTEFKRRLADQDLVAAEAWLSQQVWFGASGDMEILRNFWLQNFHKRPSFRPNFIVPNNNSILRSIAQKEGLAVLPSYLVKHQLMDEQVQVVWEGSQPLKSTLYFAQRKKTIYSKEIEVLQQSFLKEFGGSCSR
ncbi:LysR family transcriptional regulator [Hymenobacter coccineus]|uniref:LysR family transcriptional regulator n=1 Tax=Hymenobacter coccineus TaxID=1908235 RepID=A0A1G1SU83_9BACT|nr:LysR family transcriptional regulator [Hymenobacter coccineus]OGX82163.1 LysR family transcriptional regulator [Hymenobacter coccineus]